MSEIHNLAIEQCVLAALMTVKNSLETVMGDLSENCFYATKHQAIYQAIVDLANENKPYDILFVEQKLNEKKPLVGENPSVYLMTLMAESASSFYNLESYVAELNKLKMHREVEFIGQQIAQKAKDLSLPNIHLEAENLLSGSTDEKAEKTNFTFQEGIEKSIKRMIAKSEARANKQYTGVKFNIPHLDNLLGSIESGHFCVIGGRPGSGKSTLAQMLMIQTTRQYNKAVLFVSAEMDTETLTNRCMSALSQIPYNNIHNGELYDGMFEQYTDAKERFQNLPIIIEEKQKPTIAEVHSYARKAKRKYKALGCIIVDYLGLVRDPSKKDRIQEVSSISRDLKAMAKEFDCPVIALAQLNRESEKKAQPTASDLKDSGQIEQDADQIIMVNPVASKADEAPTGITELIVAKNRHGKKGVVRVMDRLDICRFMGITEQVGGGV